MQLLGKTIHVLAVGLWFGTAVFFTFVVALSLFRSFETASAAGELAAWFPAAEKLEAKEQGNRAAGFAVGPLFDYYFLLQGIRGFAAAVTVPGLVRGTAAKVHKVRAAVVLLALGTVVAAWPIEQKVGVLRDVRNEAIERRSAPGRATPTSPPRPALLRDEFRLAGTRTACCSNLVTLALVTVTMALAARLPEPPARPVGERTVRRAAGGTKSADTAGGGCPPGRLIALGILARCSASCPGGRQQSLSCRSPGQQAKGGLNT